MSIKLDKLREVLGEELPVEKMEAILALDEADVDVSEYETKIADLQSELEHAKSDFESRIKSLWFGKVETSEPEVEVKGVEAKDEHVDIKSIADIIEETI